MVKNLVVDDYLVAYLTKVAKQNAKSVGLMLGQSSPGKDYIVHFAKTPPFQSEEDKKLGKPVQNLRSVDEVNPDWIADHAKQATRMLPGGMNVLGVFVVSSESLLSPLHSKLKFILQTIQKELGVNKYLYGNHSSEKIILHFSPELQKYSCKSYDVVTHNIQPVEVKLSPKNWKNIECEFCIDKIRYLKKSMADWPLEKHIKVMLDEIHDSLESSIFLYGERFTQENDLSDNLCLPTKTEPVRVSIFTKGSITSSNDPDKIIDTSGQLRIVGQVSCKLWLQHKISIKDASTAIKQDIMRSLESRLEMHWDSLTEEENSEDVNCIHEPPRRVLITLPNSKITLSDYLFPGEGPQDAEVSLEELLDIKIRGHLEIHDVEGQADITEYCKGALESDSKEILPNLNSEAKKFMYLGVIVAVIVFILSLLMHFYL